MTALSLAKMKKALTHEDFLHVHEVLSQLTSDLGWTRAWTTLQDAIAGTVGTGWYSVNLTILSVFKMEELIGYDGDVPEVLATLQNTRNFGEVDGAFFESMTDRVRNQLTRHGSTRRRWRHDEQPL
ncbi:MAG: hypothetical protein ACE5H4_12800 [Candidatus Thorarchaeota archaeon]